MRKSTVHWFSRFDVPQTGRPLIFDFGAGPVVGRFEAGKFIIADQTASWDRVLVNCWRYSVVDEAAQKAIA